MTKLSPRVVTFPKSMDSAARKAVTDKRANEIMELTQAELDECLASGELTQAEYNGESNTRRYYEGMNPAQLEFDCTYIAHAVYEKERREGKRPR